MSQVKGQVIRQHQDRKCPWAAILITEISVADNRLGISSQWYTRVYTLSDSQQPAFIFTVYHTLYGLVW